MKKIPDEIDNPVDNALIHFGDRLCPFFKHTRHTPNILTTYSLITGLVACYFLYKKHMILFSIFYLLSYFFDCIDGHFARKYAMTSNIGDMYDHIKDGFIFILIIWIVYKNCGKITIPVIGVFLFFFIMMTIHFSCQEKNCDDKYKDKDNSFIFVSKSLCGDKDNIKWTRYFGVGTFQIIFMILVCYICRCKRDL